MASAAFDNAEDAHCDPAALRASVAELAELPPVECLLKLKEVAREYKLSSSNLAKLVRDKRKTDKERAERAQAEAAFAARVREKVKAEVEPKPVVADESDLIEKLRESAKELIGADSVLAKLREHLTQHEGYAGSTAPAERTFVALASRFEPRPINIRRLSPAATGKTYSVDVILPLFPDDTYIKFSASSERALIYSDESYEHKYLIVGEQDSIPSDGPAASAIRSIVQENVMTYDVVEKAEDNKWKVRHIVKQGPTGIILTGIKALEDDQMDTRTLTDYVSDDAEQTRHIVRMQALIASGEYTRTTDERQKFVDFQKYLVLKGERRVVVPFAVALAELIPVTNVRVRRDFPQILTTIKALAFLGQFHPDRQNDALGRVVATWRDYEDACDLLASVLDISITDDVSPAVRETVSVVSKAPAGGVSISSLMASLKLSKSGCWVRVNKAIDAGYLVNLEERKGWPACIGTTTQPLPDPKSALPTVVEILKAESGQPPLLEQPEASADEVVPF